MKISEIADVKGGKRLPKGEELSPLPTDHPYIRAQDIREGKIVIDDPRFLTLEQHQRLKRYVVAAGDVCIVIVGANVGDVGIVPKHLHGANLTENAVKLTRFRDDCVPQYVNYCLSAPAAQAQMQQIAGGAAQPKLGIYKVLDVEIPFHPKTTQERIASILSAYDDLIENNTRRIKILEEMAQMLYREWFVHFRFPGHEKVRMAESELGPIPERWTVARVLDFGNVVTGKTPSKARPDFYGDAVPFIKLPDMHGNVFVLDTGERLSHLGQASQANKTIPENSLCVSCIGTAGIVVITTRPSQTNQQINSVVLDARSDREFLYFRLLDLRETINQYGANGATMVNLNKTKFENLKLARPPHDIVTSFHAQAAPMLEQIRNFQQRNGILRTTRDLLLPKLISGEIPVEVAEDEAAAIEEEIALHA